MVLGNVYVYMHIYIRIYISLFNCAKIKAFIVSLGEHAAKQYLFQEFEKIIVQKTLANM